LIGMVSVPNTLAPTGDFADLLGVVRELDVSMSSPSYFR